MPSAELVNADWSPAPTLFLVPERPLADDLAARCLLRRAQGALQKWPEGFGGFRAVLRGETAAGPVDGHVVVRATGRIEVECEDPDLRARLDQMLRTLVARRTPRFFDDGDGRFPIRFGEPRQDDGGAERAIEVHVRSGRLTYWIDAAGRIRRRERIHRGYRVVSAVEEYCRATPGRVLPVRIAVTTWDAASGALLAAEVIQDSHRRLEHVWLPVSRRVAAADDNRPALTFRLDDHQLL